MARLGLIGGSGLDVWAAEGRPVDLNTPYGPASGPAMLFAAGRHEVVFVPRHGGDHALAPHQINYRANMDLFRQQQVDAIIAVNTVGSVTEACPPGGLCIPDQLIDYTWGRDHSFVDPHQPDVLHVEFANPFDPHWREALLDAARASGLSAVAGGCLAVTQGPRLETAAEVRRLQRDGCDLVGMTSMPEAALAREAGLAYACLAVSANWAAGVQDQAISMAAIGDVLSVAMKHVRRVIQQLLEHAE